MNGRGYDAEYGLFAPTGQVTGRRRYGKTGAGNFLASPEGQEPPEFERTAFCQIYRWASSRNYENDPASPCAG